MAACRSLMPPQQFGPLQPHTYHLLLSAALGHFYMHATWGTMANKLVLNRTRSMHVPAQPELRCVRHAWRQTAQWGPSSRRPMTNAQYVLPPVPAVASWHI